MKTRILLIAFALMSAMNASYAQYEKGDLAVNAGISFGLIGYGYGYYSDGRGMPPLSVNVEYSTNNMLAFGPYLGIYTRSYGGGDFRFTAMSFGARGTFHASEFLNDKAGMDINTEKLDIYGTVLLGFERYTWKYADHIADGYYSSGSRVIFGPVLGIKYFFTPAFGVYFEGGRGAFGYGTLGVSAKL